MFSVSGAGTFLSEVVRNSYEANVETKYKTTPISQRISDINIGKTYPEECQSDRYTHIVSGVTLGLEAYMTFKFEAQKESEANEVSGDMEIIVKNIPAFSVSGQGTLDLSQSQQEIINKTVITAFGDFSPDNQLPTSYEAAVDFYSHLQDIPSNTSNTWSGVSVLEVHMVPITGKEITFFILFNFMK